MSHIVSPDLPDNPWPLFYKESEYIWYYLLNVSIPCSGRVSFEAQVRSIHVNKHLCAGFNVFCRCMHIVHNLYVHVSLGLVSICIHFHRDAYVHVSE